MEEDCIFTILEQVPFKNQERDVFVNNVMQAFLLGVVWNDRTVMDSFTAEISVDWCVCFIFHGSFLKVFCVCFGASLLEIGYC